jgi:hypothetical protein
VFKLSLMIITMRLSSERPRGHGINIHCNKGGSSPTAKKNFDLVVEVRTTRPPFLQGGIKFIGGYYGYKMER